MDVISDLPCEIKHLSLGVNLGSCVVSRQKKIVFYQMTGSRESLD
jgi:hypothetical protein